MYLVHARLHGPLDVSLPSETRSLVLAQARDEDGIEHVAVHPHAQPHPVIGRYVRAESLAAAEAQTTVAFRRVLSSCAEFGGWSLLVTQAQVVDAIVQGRFGPAEISSHPSDQRRK